MNISLECMRLLELRTSFHTGFQRFGGLVKLLFCVYSADGNAAFWMLVSIRMMLSIFSDRCMWRLWQRCTPYITFTLKDATRVTGCMRADIRPHGYQLMMTHPNRDTKREEILTPAFSHHSGKKANSQTLTVEYSGGTIVLNNYHIHVPCNLHVIFSVWQWHYIQWQHIKHDVQNIMVLTW